MQRRLAAGLVERAAQNLAINRHHTLAGLGKPRHEPLETTAELLGVEQTEQPAERVVARSAVLQPEEAAQEPQLDPGELRHVGAVFSAGQYRAQRDHQHLKQIVPTGVARPRIVQARKAGCETVHRRPRVVTYHRVENRFARAAQSPHRPVKQIPYAFPCRERPKILPATTAFNIVWPAAACSGGR